MRLQNSFEKIKALKKDYGKIGGMAGTITVLPSIGSMILMLVIYQISPWLQENKELGIPLFVVFMTVFSGVALIATNMLGILSGFAFDFYWGISAQILGVLGASIVMFFFAKRLAKESLQNKIEEKPKLKAIHKALLNENFYKTLIIIFLIRLSPAMPFALTNFMMSATGISFRTYLIGTLFGMLPRASAIVFVGSSLSELNFSQPQESWILIVGIIATILAVIVVGLVSKRALENLIIEQPA